MQKRQNNKFKRVLLIEKMSESEKRTLFFDKLQETILDFIIKKNKKIFFLL